MQSFFWTGDPEEYLYLHEVRDMTKINCRAIIKTSQKKEKTLAKSTKMGLWHKVTMFLHVLQWQDWLKSFSLDRIHLKIVHGAEDLWKSPLATLLVLLSMVIIDYWCKIAETRADTSTSHGSIITKIPGLLGMSTTYHQWVSWNFGKVWEILEGV